MIIIIEGAQGSGKSHLINKLKRLLEHRNPDLNKDIIFYKYNHVKYMNELNFNEIEPGASFHYFTISNTLTILELHKTVLKDKILVFDRGIFSAYAWSIMRNRIPKNILNEELTNLLKLDLYSNCHIIRIKSKNIMKRDHSDLFDKYTDSTCENIEFDNILNNNINLISNGSKNNSFVEFENQLDIFSEIVFYKTFLDIAKRN